MAIANNWIDWESITIFKRCAQLSYIGQDVRQIPSIIIKIYGPNATKLDLSYNMIDTLDGLDSFTQLRELILDNNLLDDNIRFCFNPLLHTLSMNKNKVFVGQSQHILHCLWNSSQI